MTTIVADGQGVMRLKFTIPANVPAGNKQVSLVGAGGQKGDTIFAGQGTLEHQIWQQETDVTVTRWQSPPPPRQVRAILGILVDNGTHGGQNPVDPLAQTFTMVSNTQIGAVDLWFTAVPTTPATVQIRSTSGGFPGQDVIAEAKLAPGSIVIGGASTRFTFPAPALLLGGVEYAIVVMCNDATGAISVAEIGKFDSTAGVWITNQPYNVGVLLSSSNASTWTAHQDRDMAFRLLEANFTATTRTVALGTVAVTAATDLLLLSYFDRPDGAANVQYTLTLPDASVITVSDGQPVQLAAPITGNVTIAAILTGTADFSPVLLPGTQLIVGQIATTGSYVTRAILGGTGVTVKSILEAVVPSGATLTVQYKGPDIGDTWQTMSVDSTRAVDDGFTEFVHKATSVTEATVQIKITLTGTTAARPRVRDLRAYVL